MIYLGLDSQEKQRALSKYLKDNPEINKAYIFYPGKFPTELIPGIEMEGIEWKEIIMYRTFYPLLEKIDKNSLIVVDELMRTQKRSDLTYNCLKHYLNQCGHRLVFQYLPFIDDEPDFMILVDMLDSWTFKGWQFDGTHSKVQYSDDVLKAVPVSAVNRVYELEKQGVSLSPADMQEYQDKAKELFDSLGNKDPDTIPRNLEAFVGKYKKEWVDSGCKYLMRNQRFKFDGATTTKDVQPGEFYIVFDFPHRTIEWNDFLYVTKQQLIPAMVTTTSVDQQYFDKYRDLSERLEAFYAKTDVYQ